MLISHRLNNGSMRVIIKTNRMILRELDQNDHDALSDILSDPETMSHYPAPFTSDEVTTFIEKNIERYQTINCGLWGCILIETDKLIGDCGITIQNIDGVNEYEIGYHFHKDYWGNGYAIEAAKAVKEYGFNHLGLKKLCSYMAEDHKASRRLAERNNMKIEKTFLNPRNRNFSTVVYTKTKGE